MTRVKLPWRESRDNAEAVKPMLAKRWKRTRRQEATSVYIWIDRRNRPEDAESGCVRIRAANRLVFGVANIQSPHSGLPYVVLVIRTLCP